MAIAQMLKTMDSLPEILNNLDDGMNLYSKYQSDKAAPLDAFKRISNVSNDLIYARKEMLHSLKGSNIENSPLFFPLKVMDHDMMGLATAVNMFLYLTATYSRLKNTDAFDKLYGNGYSFHEYENLRLSLNVMNYLYSEDSSSLLSVPSHSIKPLLDSIIRDESVISVTNDTNFDIPSDVYFSLMQCTKNAYHNFSQYKELDSKDRSININIVKKANFIDYSISDNGSGISPDVLPNIFGTYTSDGTGIGLQLVDTINTLRGGKLFVITDDGTGSYIYNKLNNSITSLDTSSSNGTSFYISTSHF